MLFRSYPVGPRRVDGTEQLDVHGAARDHGLGTGDPLGQGLVGDLDEITGMAGEAVGRAGQVVDQQGEQRRIVGEVGVQAGAGGPLGPVQAAVVGGAHGEVERLACRDPVIPLGTVGPPTGGHCGAQVPDRVPGADGDVRAVMWWAVVPAVLSVALTFLVRDPARSLSASDEPPHVPLVDLPLPRMFWTTALPIVTIALTNLPDTLLLLRLAQLGASTSTVVWCYIAFNAVYTLAAYPAGVLSSRLSPGGPERGRRHDS